MDESLQPLSEARQWAPGVEIEGVRWSTHDPVLGPVAWAETFEGGRLVFPGNWIVRRRPDNQIVILTSEEYENLIDNKSLKRAEAGPPLPPRGPFLIYHDKAYYSDPAFGPLEIGGEHTPQIRQRIARDAIYAWQTELDNGDHESREVGHREWLCEYREAIREWEAWAEQTAPGKSLEELDAEVQELRAMVQQALIHW
jgi:hypothetical protein